ILIITFVKNRNLHKRSMYLVISLAVADALVGGFSCSISSINLGSMCHLWKEVEPYGGSRIWHRIYFPLWVLFPIASLADLTAISVERMHATFRPFRHRVITKRFYAVVIAASWITAALLSTSLVFLHNHVNKIYAWNSFSLICLFVICLSYSFIAVKMFCGRHSPHRRSVNRERKLTKTLFIVTVVSLLMWLPHITTSLLLLSTDMLSSYSLLQRYQVASIFLFLYYANSLVNPILYATRMSDFRRALIVLFCRNPQNQVSPAFIMTSQTGA
ncbi:melanocortin receptor 5-like, partial [Montipora foliosa]|uniref:melanocortin receptor 5-like n=1 Tax=Montipora foliosa TaxID=591990 RepID=UPI0035F13CE0